VRVFDAAVEKAYGGEREIVWMEVYAGEKALEKTGEWLPEETLDALREFRVGIKGPLTTPVGGGIRSLNVTLRQVLDLYACIRPVRYFEGVPSGEGAGEARRRHLPREHRGRLRRHRVEGGQRRGEQACAFLRRVGREDPREAAIGIKPMSSSAPSGWCAMAIRYALARNGRDSVTLVHKGNIMKFTEGAFRDWGYEVAKERVRRADGRRVGAWEGRGPAGTQVVDQGPDRRRDVPAAAAPPRRVLGARHAEPERRLHVRRGGRAGGGLGMAPGANVGDEVAVFEATHGTAPKYANRTRSTRAR
jgi:isocitrate dehydrogenase